MFVCFLAFFIFHKGDGKGHIALLFTLYLVLFSFTISLYSLCICLILRVLFYCQGFDVAI